eukprot:TRINITY_DN66399_c0_g1_i1.p1 TRINITY_DN66399_c0_g1~~TRINITY_DN66399_c0_g1_i1.p1  ORF type:complete len:392 (-),score=92.23 TRINITY_DN66399_c0_g1_i1:298-1473(-)
MAAVHAESRSKEELLKEISELKAELSASRLVKVRRTRLLSLSGESCDFLQALPPRITVKELRAKLAESKNVRTSRVKLFRGDGQEPVADEEEVHHELQTGPDMNLTFCSTGNPFHLVVSSGTRIVFTGLVKCKLDHKSEYETYHREAWLDHWVHLSVEVNDLGRGKNEQLRIFIGSVDLVRYGNLQNPHVRQLETWGNTNAGKLEILFGENKTAPPFAGPPSPGLYVITLLPRAGGKGFFVADRPTFPQGDVVQQLGQLKEGDKINVLEVVTPEKPQSTWERRYAHFTYGRIDFKGKTGWVPLEAVNKEESFVALSGEGKFCTAQICRRYVVERGDGKSHCSDTSEIWFADELDCASFKAAFSSWLKDNPQPKLRCGFNDTSEEEEEMNLL